MVSQHFEGLPDNNSDVIETGWDYKAIALEQQELDRQQKQILKIACPKCGAILQVNGEGVRNCYMGHYRREGEYLDDSGV